MSQVVVQARGVIRATSAAIAASWKEPSTYLTLLARIIVSEAKKERPDDAAIQSIDLDTKIPDWNDISAAMNVIVKTFG